MIVKCIQWGVQVSAFQKRKSVVQQIVSSLNEKHYVTFNNVSATSLFPTEQTLVIS